MEDREILINEYRSLRSEILKRQDSRLLLVGFSITAIAALLGILLKDNSTLSNFTYASISMFIGVFLIITIALLLNLQQTQQIDILFKNLKISEILSSYLGKFTDDLSNNEVKTRIYLSSYYLALSIIMIVIAYFMSIFTIISNIIIMSLLFILIIILFLLNIRKGIHGTDFQTDYLIDFLENDEDERIRVRSARALGTTTDIKAIKQLLKSFLDPSYTVRKESAKALINIGEVAIKLIIKDLNNCYKDIPDIKYYPDVNLPIENVLDRLIYVLGEIGDKEAIEPLIKLYNYKSDIVIDALAKINIHDENLFKLFIKSLKNEKSDTRKNAVIILEKIGNKDAIKPLIVCLDDKDPEVRREIMKTLVLIGNDDSEVFHALLKQLEETDPYFVEEAASALLKLGNKKAIPYLEIALKRLIDENIDDYRVERIRNAIKNLGKI